MNHLTIQFELRPLADVEPWTRDGRPELFWYALTDGWYDVVLDEHRLFSSPACDPRGIDYQVVRLWEDLIDATPT